MIRKLLSSLVLASAVMGAALAQDGAPVYCGSFTPFHIRASAEGRTADARANQAMDVINKYLGGNVGKISTKQAGSAVKVLLNGETVCVVTAADAKAEKQSSAMAVAQKWSRALSKAFEESKAQK